MANEVFVAFWAGACCGLIFGIMMTAVFVAVAVNDRKENNDNDKV